MVFTKPQSTDVKNVIRNVLPAKTIQKIVLPAPKSQATRIMESAFKTVPETISQSMEPANNATLNVMAASIPVPTVSTAQLDSSNADPPAAKTVLPTNLSIVAATCA